MHPAFCRKGLATEAMQAILAYGFDVLRPEKIITLTSPENVASRRLVERLGMGQSKDAQPYGYEDCVLYSVTRDLWQASVSD